MDREVIIAVVGAVSGGGIIAFGQFVVTLLAARHSLRASDRKDALDEVYRLCEERGRERNDAVKLLGDERDAHTACKLECQRLRDLAERHGLDPDK